MKWITGERPNIDRIACPWLVARFIDVDAEFLYAARRGAAQRASKRRDSLQRARGPGWTISARFAASTPRRVVSNNVTTCSIGAEPCRNTVQSRAGA